MLDVNDADAQRLPQREQTHETPHQRIDFSAINRCALSRLPDLLRRWLPGGRMEGHEYVVKNPLRVDQSLGSFSINTITGLWSDFIPGGPSGGDSIALYAYLYGLKMGDSARRLAAELGLDTNRAEPNKAESEKPPDTVTPIVPVPEDAAQFFWRHPQYGEPVATWPYHNADGQLVGYAARVEWIEDGERKKDIMPVCWCRTDHARGVYHSWRSKGVPKPRPLYRLPELLAEPDAPVIVTEGEKKADRVPALSPGYVGTTSMGGSKAAPNSDWSHLAGRDVTVWPDNDKPGRDYADMVAGLATDAGAASVRVVDVPQDWPDAWDLADDLPEGVHEEDLVALLRSARPWTPSQEQAPNPEHSGDTGGDTEFNDIQTAIGTLQHGDMVSPVIDRIAAAELTPTVQGQLLDKIKLRTGVRIGDLRDELQSAKNKIKAKRKEVGRAFANWSAIVKRYASDSDTPGEIRPMMVNVALIIRNTPEFRDAIWYNEFTDSITVRRPLPWDSDDGFKERDWTDYDELKMTEWLQGMDDFINAPPHVVFQGVETVAREQRYHPVRDYLDSLVWDGVPRIDRLLPYYFGCEREDPGYLKAISAKSLIQAVVRIYRPGIKADCMLTLEGDQGIRKSTGLRILFDPLDQGWFTDDAGELGTTDSKMKLRGKWGVELGEFAGLSKLGIRQAKAFLSSTDDEYRPPYGRRQKKFPRQNVFISSTNDEEVLNDPSGGRRFWFAWCIRIDIDALWNDRHQLWAEAVYRYRNKERWHIDDAEIEKAARVEQSKRQESDVWDDQIIRHLNVFKKELEIKRGTAALYEADPNADPKSRKNAVYAAGIGVTTSEILVKGIGKKLADIEKKDQMRVAAVLRRLGWTRDQVRDGRLRGLKHYLPPADGGSEPDDE